MASVDVVDVPSQRWSVVKEQLSAQLARWTWWTCRASAWSVVKEQLSAQWARWTWWMRRASAWSVVKEQLSWCTKLLQA